MYNKDGESQRQRSRSIDISRTKTRHNALAELEYVIDRETDLLADVWKENIPLVCRKQGKGGMEDISR